MGRTIKILDVNVYDEEGDSFVVTNKTQQIIEQLRKKYDLTEFLWEFVDDNELVFKNNRFGKQEISDLDMETHIKALLELVKIYDRKISGYILYKDEDGGGSYIGIVYIASDYTALIRKFDSDINISDLSELSKFIGEEIINPFNIPIFDETKVKLSDHVVIKYQHKEYNYVIRNIEKDKSGMPYNILIAPSSISADFSKLIKVVSYNGNEWQVAGLVEPHSVIFN